MKNHSCLFLLYSKFTKQFFSLLTLSFIANSQNVKDTVYVKFEVPSMVKDTLELNFSVLIRNTGKSMNYFYAEIKDGYIFDNEANSDFKLEKCVNGKYKYYPARFINYKSSENDSALLSKEYFSLITLRPNEQTILNYDFAHISGGLDKGFYRIKFILKVKPILEKRPNVFFKLENGELQNDYLESNFYYFRVLNDAYIKHKPN